MTFKTPEGSESVFSEERTLISNTRPLVPLGTRKDVSFRTFSFSSKMALINFCSGETRSWNRVVTLPTKIAFGSTQEPTRITPSGSRLDKCSSVINGMSLVISSFPNFVCRKESSNFSICIEVKRLSEIRRSLITKASS